MDIARFGYLALALLLGLAAIGAWVAGFNYFRNRPAQLSAKDKLIGFMLAGPFFGALHSSLSARGYTLTQREKLGLLLIFGVAAVIIIGAIVSGNART
jgi:hypothetical protein